MPSLIPQIKIIAPVSDGIAELEIAGGQAVVRTAGRRRTYLGGTPRWGSGETGMTQGVLFAIMEAVEMNECINLVGRR
jgi:hypothetical protein